MSGVDAKQMLKDYQYEEMVPGDGMWFRKNGRASFGYEITAVNALTSGNNDEFDEEMANDRVRDDYEKTPRYTTPIATDKQVSSVISQWNRAKSRNKRAEAIKAVRELKSSVVLTPAQSKRLAEIEAQIEDYLRP